MRSVLQAIVANAGSSPVWLLLVFSIFISERKETMTAQELIKKLSRFDPDAPVQICLDGEASPFVRVAFNDGPYVVLTNGAGEDSEDDGV